ncbi:MAG: cysteine--tRNA ligase [Acidobacteria bacterium]|nr:cysteine--tRNA ligase [Acidobacteriota bacterium]
MSLALYNTLTRRKEPFEPIEPGHVRMYVCGPTVYDEPHLGHARAAIAFDVIRRTLEALGMRVTYVRNVTDVDDKIIARAAEGGRSPWEVAEENTRAYDDAMRALGVRPPTLAPRATGHISDMLRLIGVLVERGFAYTAGGDVYFSVERSGGYGRLSNRTLEEMRAGERVEPDARKRHPMDFALWKAAKPGELSWPSEWGEGRPGWHIECSAMSMKYLGETFDIHGGGLDLIFPHHENEVAQSTGATGSGFARFWLHNGFVTVNREKMAKSLKNFVTVREMLGAWPAPALRYLLVSAHYRSPIDFSPEAVEDAAGAWRRLAGFARNAGAALASAGAAVPGAAPALGALLPGARIGTSGTEGGEWRERFAAALEDDVGCPEAIAVLFDLVASANRMIERAESRASELAAALGAFRDLAAVLGLDPGAWDAPRRGGSLAPAVELLLRVREEARAARDFARADEIRSALADSGIVVEDRPGGPRWYLAG